MEPVTEKPEEQETPRPSQPGVMDITPPTQNPANQQATTETPVAAAPELTQDEATTEQTSAAGDDPVKTDETTETTPAPTPLAAAPAPKSSGHKTPIVAIVLAVLIAACLAVFAIFAYNKSNEPAPAKQNDTSQTEDKATEADVDEVIQDVDQTLNGANDETDFDTNSINDSSLGL